MVNASPERDGGTNRAPTKIAVTLKNGVVSSDIVTVQKTSCGCVRSSGQIIYKRIIYIK